MKTSYLSVFVVVSFLLGPAPAQADTPLKVQATLIEMPKSPPCKDREVHRVVVRYRVDRVLSGKLEGKHLFVMHRCPRIPRGPSRYGRGDAGSMRPGRVHVLTLVPLVTRHKVLDRFTEDRPGARRKAAAAGVQTKPQRYWAKVTDPAPKDMPRVTVVVSGGAGTRHRVDFDRGQVTVGRAYTSDILLTDRTVASLHLRLVIDGDKISVRPTAATNKVKINGKRIKGPTKITFKDRVKVGGYELRVALFLSPRPEA